MTAVDPAVTFVLDQPGLLDVLLSEHWDDGSSYCRACPGPQSGRRRFPCDIRRIADRALAMRDSAER